MSERKKLLDYMDRKKASEFNFKIEIISVTANGRTLKCDYTVELDDELHQWLAEDAEREKEEDGISETEAFELH